jgi:hypothetical protein
VNRWGIRGLCDVSILLLLGGFMSSGSARVPAAPPYPSGSSNEREAIRQFVDQHCVACHNRDDQTAGLALDAISSDDVRRNSNACEKFVRKLVARQMPPPGEVRPSCRTYDSFVCLLAGVLDRPAAEEPRPGRTGALPRLTRTEYQNAIRDVLQPRFRQHYGEQPLTHTVGTHHYRYVVWARGWVQYLLPAVGALTNSRMG